MSITSVKTGTTGLSLALDNNYMEPIATTVVGFGGVNQITFTDIPQTYKHLHIRLFGRISRTSGVGSGFQARLNGDTGASSYYQSHGLSGDGASATANADGTNNVLNYDRIASDVYSANIYGAGFIDILDYTNTNKYKTTKSLIGFDSNGAGRIFLTSNLWLNTSPITSITFIPDSASWNQYSRFSLYGIKG